MKTRTNIHAGADSLTTCQRQRDYWKAQADRMEVIAKSNKYPQPQPWPQPQPQPQPQPTGGYVNGIWYGDRSGWCG